MGFKVLIADDEIGMRIVIKKILEKVDGFDIIAEAANGLEALKSFEKYRPNVVFLDVEMSELTGIECARKISDINPKTIIIFATAHSQYMPEAFQIYAFDYLIKPFKIERVLQTLNRIKSLHQVNQKENLDKIIRYEKNLDKLMIKSKDGISFINSKDIILVQREEKTTVIYTLDDSFITSLSLTDIEDKLDKSQFFRSHKSYIINLSMISKIYPYGRWTYIVKLKGIKSDALLTHEKYEEIKRVFSL